MAEKALGWDVDVAAASPWSESDGFDRPDGDLGPDWAIRYVWVQPPDAGVTVKGNEMCQFGDDEVEATWLHPVPSDDMRVEFTVGTLVATNYTIQLRGALDAWPTIEASMGTMPPPPGQGMEPYMGPKIVKKNSSSDGGVGLAYADWEAALLPGQRLSFEVVGNDYSFKVDGVEKVAWSGADMPTGPNNRLVRVSISSSAGAGKPESTLDDFQVTDLGPLAPVEYTLAMDGTDTATLTSASTLAEIESALNATTVPVGLAVSGDPAATYEVGVDTVAELTASGGAVVTVTTRELASDLAGEGTLRATAKDLAEPPPISGGGGGEPKRVTIRINGTMWFANDVYGPAYACGAVGEPITFSATVAPRLMPRRRLRTRPRSPAPACLSGWPSASTAGCGSSTTCTSRCTPPTVRAGRSPSVPRWHLRPSTRTGGMSSDGTPATPRGVRIWTPRGLPVGARRARSGGARRPA